MDITAMESCKGQVGKRNRKMGRLSEAVEGSKFDRPKELVVPRVVHDRERKMMSGIAARCPMARFPLS
jgi:hypothetical protein